MVSVQDVTRRTNNGLALAVHKFLSSRTRNTSSCRRRKLICLASNGTTMSIDVAKVCWANDRSTLVSFEFLAIWAHDDLTLRLGKNEADWTRGHDTNSSLSFVSKRTSHAFVALNDHIRRALIALIFVGSNGVSGASKTTRETPHSITLRAVRAHVVSSDES